MALLLVTLVCTLAAGESALPAPPLPPSPQLLPVEAFYPPAASPATPEGADAGAILYALARSEDPGQRRTAIAAFDTRHDAFAVYLAVKALADPDAETRHAALDACGRAEAALLSEQALGLWLREEPEGAAVLAALPTLRHVLERPFLALLEQPGAPLAHRVWAVHGLGRMGSTGAVPALRLAAWQEDPTLAWYALWALAALPPEVAVQPLLELCRHPWEHTRWAAVDAAAVLPGHRATTGLGELLSQLPTNESAMAARLVTILKDRNDIAAVPYLIDALERFPQHLELGGGALRAITGEELSNAPQAWRDWDAARRGAAPRRSSPARTNLFELTGVDTGLINVPAE